MTSQALCACRASHGCPTQLLPPAVATPSCWSRSTRAHNNPPSAIPLVSIPMPVLVTSVLTRALRAEGVLRESTLHGSAGFGLHHMLDASVCLTRSTMYAIQLQSSNSKSRHKQAPKFPVQLCPHLQAVNVVVVEYEPVPPHPQQPQHGTPQGLLHHPAVSCLVCGVERHKDLWQTRFQLGTVPAHTTHTHTAHLSWQCMEADTHCTAACITTNDKASITMGPVSE